MHAQATRFQIGRYTGEGSPDVLRLRDEKDIQTDQDKISISPSPSPFVVEDARVRHVHTDEGQAEVIQRCIGCCGVCMYGVSPAEAVVLHVCMYVAPTARLRDR